MMHLKVQEKILLHLYDYRKYDGRYEYPVEMTQQGIAKSVGISVTHVPRNIKKLIEEELIYSKKGHVSGKKKRVTVYLLTSQGIAVAKEIIENIESQNIEINGIKINIGELKKRLNMHYLELLNKIDKGELDEKYLTMKERLIFKEVNIRDELFIDRDGELEIMKKWYAEGKFLSIVGGQGSGKTSLVNKFIEEQVPTENVIWFNLYPGRKWANIKEVFQTLFGGIDVLTILKKYPTLLIFDSYFDVDDEFVSALQSLVHEELNLSKIIVVMRNDTPYYNRFYTLADIAEQRVVEIRLEGLSYEHARELLKDVKESAFKRIYQLSKGNPRILVALKNGTIDAMSIPLPPDQIHLLKYLASQKI